MIGTKDGVEGARGERDDTIWQRGAHKCDILWQRDEQWEVGRRGAGW